MPQSGKKAKARRQSPRARGKSQKNVRPTKKAQKGKKAKLRKKKAPRASQARPEVSTRIEFPKMSQVVDSRQEMVTLLRDQYPNVDEPLWLVHGKGVTKAFAEVYAELIREQWRGKLHCLRLEHAPQQEEVEERLKKWLKSKGGRPALVIYVGGQSVADSAKWMVRQLRKNKKLKKVNFGGIITVLSSDGVFSTSATLHDKKKLPQSRSPTAVPHFVVGHRLTLLRQPYRMKLSCIGDILSKASSLWDYNYSCRRVNKYHNDFAADLTKTAYMTLHAHHEKLREFWQAYLHTEEFLNDLFRAVQLCGLSMQLTRTSETCSGSEHVGLKWIEDYVMRYRQQFEIFRPNKEPDVTVPAHGETLMPMTITTMYLQGQAKLADAFRSIASHVGLSGTARGINIPARVFRMCLVLGIGFRCPLYLVHLLGGGPRPDAIGNERLTVLEEVETDDLGIAIKNAMVDAGVAEPEEFDQDLTDNETRAIEEAVKAALKRLEGKLRKVGVAEDTSKRVLRRVGQVILRTEPWLKVVGGHVA